MKYHVTIVTLKQAEVSGRCEEEHQKEAAERRSKEVQE